MVIFMKNRWSLAIFILIPWLNGCDLKKDLLSRVDIPEVKEKSISIQDGTIYMSVSSVPLIQQVLEGNTPLFQGKTNNKIMEMVCQYAAGDISRETFDSYFESHNVDIDKLSQKDPGFKFLADKSITNYERGCASYINSKFFSYELLSQSEKLTDTDTFSKRLKQLTPTALLVSHYIAEIAATHNKSYDSIQSFKYEINDYIAKTAKVFIMDVMHAKYTPELYDYGGKESGITYEVKGDRINLYMYGSLWLGQGKAMGTDYKINLKI